MKIRGNENRLGDRIHSRTKGYIRPDGRRLYFNGWLGALLFALASCLTIIVSGCSSAAANPAAQSGGSGSSQVSAQLTISATSLNFGSVPVNSAGLQSLTLTSTGTSAVTISSATISGTGFTIIGSSFPATLSPGQSLTFPIQFQPTTAGALAGQLTINSNSTTGGTAQVALSGAGTTASVTQGNQQLTISAMSLNFGNVAVNSTGLQTLTLTSTGTSAVTINSATIAGAGFTIVAQTLPVTLNPNQSLTLQLQFLPTTAGALTGQLTINSNSTTGSTAVVALNGTGTGSPQLTIGSASVSFGSTAMNTATTQSLTLTSTGTAAVTISSAVITGAGFTIVGGSFPVTLNSGQTLTLQLSFDPTTTGTLTGQLTISSNSTAGSPATIALSGTGTAVAHQVALNWIAPVSSPDPVAGYNIYRATGSGGFVRINPSPGLNAAYTDSTVTSGVAYSYQVTSVDSGGVESVPSNQVTVTIP